MRSSQYSKSDFFKKLRVWSSLVQPMCVDLRNFFVDGSSYLFTLIYVLSYTCVAIVHRKKRLAELREAAKVAKFGSIISISGSDFVREVSQAPPDVWVVVLLYKEGYYSECINFNSCQSTS